MSDEVQQAQKLGGLDLCLGLRHILCLNLWQLLNFSMPYFSFLHLVKISQEHFLKIYILY